MKYSTRQSSARIDPAQGTSHGPAGAGIMALAVRVVAARLDTGGCQAE
jgi:hypothetical protein